MRFQPQCYHQAFLSQFDCRSRKPSKLRELSSHPTMITLDESSYALSDLYAPTFINALVHIRILDKKVNTKSLVQSVLMNQELLKFTEQHSEEPFCISQNNAGRGRSLGLITWYLPLTGFCFTGITAGYMSQIMSRRARHVVEFASRRRNPPTLPHQHFFLWGGAAPYFC